MSLSETIGRRGDHLYSLPFLPLLRRNISVAAGVTTGHAKVIGESYANVHTDFRTLPLETLLEATLLGPLGRICEVHPGERLVILLDGLDEAVACSPPSILDVIPSPAAPNFPSNLLLVMSSRPGHHLVQFDASELLQLNDPAYIPAARADVERYVATRFAEEPLASALAALSDEEAEGLVADLLKKSRGEGSDSSGNFLYLHYYFAEAIKLAVTPGADLRDMPRPRGLDEIYHSFALKKIWIEMGGSAASQLQAVLGALVVAAEPLDRILLAAFASVEPVTVDGIVARLVQFLDVERGDTGDRFRLFHTSFREFLLDPARNREHPLDAAENHARIVRYYRAGCTSWASVPWSDVAEDYPFRYLAMHLSLAGQTGELCALLDRPWFEVQLERFASLGPFIRDAAVTQRTAARERRLRLTDELRACMLRASVAYAAGQAPPELIVTLAALHEPWGAIELAQLISSQEKQVEVLCDLVTVLPPEMDGNIVLRIIERAIEIASELGANSTTSVGHFRDALLYVVRTRADRTSLERVWQLAWEVKGGDDLRPAVLRELCVSGRDEEALSLVHSIVPDSRTEYLNEIARALAEGGQMDKAQSISLEMDVGTWRTARLSDIACRYARAGMVQQARVVTAHLLADFKKAAANPWEHTTRYLPVALAASGRRQRAWGVAEGIADLLQRARSLGLLCDFFCDIGALEDAGRAVDALAALEDEVYCTGAAAALAQARLRAGQKVDARSELVRGPSRDADRVLLSICTEAARLDRDAEARDAAAGITGQYYRRVALQAIARSLAERGDEQSAAKVAADPDALISSAVILDWSATARARRGDVRGAIANIDAADTSTEGRATALLSVLTEASSGSPEQDLRNTVLFLLDLLARADVRGRNLYDGLAALRRRGLHGEADRLAKAALDRALGTARKWQRYELLSAIAPTLAAAEHPRERWRARKAVLQEIGRVPPLTRRPFQELNAVARLVQCLAAAGLTKEAQERIATETVRPREDQDASEPAAALLLAFTVGLAEAGLIDEALAATEIPTAAGDRSWARRRVVSTCRDHHHRGNSTVLRQLATAAKRAGTWRDDEVHELIAALASAGEVRDAEELANAVREPAFRRAALRNIAVAMARAGDFASAKTAVSNIASFFDQALASLEIAALAAAAGQIDEAMNELDATLSTPWRQDLLDSVDIFEFPCAIGHAIAALIESERSEAIYLVDRLAKMAADFDSTGERIAVLAAGRSLGDGRRWVAGERLVRWVKRPRDMTLLVEAFLTSATSPSGFLAPGAASVARTAASRLAELSGSERFSTSRALATSLARTGEWELAYSLASLHLNIGTGSIADWEAEHQQVTIGFASAAAAQGDLDRVKSVVAKSSSKAARDEALAAAARVFAAQGDFQGGSSVLGRISSPRIYLDAAKASASALIKSGEHDTALDLFLASCSVCADELSDCDSLVKTVEDWTELLGACNGGKALLDVLGALQRAESFFHVQGSEVARAGVTSEPGVPGERR